jgi:hypothetical protein
LATINRHIPPEQSFDPSALKAMGEAYDRALAALNRSGQPEHIRRIIARNIIELAGRGERDPVRLSLAALSALDVRR